MTKPRKTRPEPGRPTSERLRQSRGDFEIAESRGSSGTMTMRDCPLERIWGRNQLRPEEYQAAIKFRHHWFHSGMAGQISSLNLDGVFARDFSTMGFMAKTEQQAFHRQKFREACDKMGQRPSTAVINVVCEEKHLEGVGKKFGYNNEPQARACALTLVQDGLYRLAKLWGM